MDSPFYFYFIFYGENNSSKKQRQEIVSIVLMILPWTIYSNKVVAEILWNKNCKTDMFNSLFAFFHLINNQVAV